jgi:transcriptional regulator with XRE-family HTH domain
LNLTGRKPTIPYDQLEPRLREARLTHGLSMKELAQRFGYSADHIKKLCVRFGIKTRNNNPKIVVDQASEDGSK